MSSFLDIPSDSKGIAIPGRDGEYVDISTLSKTPGGSIYGTTPGGTKIRYSQNELLFLGNSPICKTPPPGMALIPGITAGGSLASIPTTEKKATPAKEEEEVPVSHEGEDLPFEMD